MRAAAGSRVDGGEVTHSPTMELGSLNIAKPWLPLQLADPFVIPECRPDGSPTRGSRWSTRGGDHATVVERR